MSSNEERVFDHVLIVLFGRHHRSQVMQNPYMRSLASAGIDLANHFGAMRVSLANCISLIAGELCNVRSDASPARLRQRTIVDLVEESPRSLRWKAYIRNFIPPPWQRGLNPSDLALPEAFAAASETVPPNPHASFHCPFSLLDCTLNAPDRWSKIQDESAFWRDLLTGDFPEYAWFAPNLWSDRVLLAEGSASASGNAGPVDDLAQWLKSFFRSLRFPGPESRLPPRTLVVVTFDCEAEADKDSKHHSDSPNQICTVLLGDMAKPCVEEQASNHYSLLRTIERNFGLSSLGKNDEGASWWQFLWGKRFRWGRAVETPIVSQGAVAAAEFDNALHVVYVGQEGRLRSRVFDGTGWSVERPVPLEAAKDVELVAFGDRLILIYKNAQGAVNGLSYTLAGGWSPTPTIIESQPVGRFSAMRIDGGDRVLLAYASAEGRLSSRRLTSNGWSEPLDVGHRTDGDIVLAAIGPSVYLIYKAAGRDEMSVLSYNTADFNAVVADEIWDGERQRMIKSTDRNDTTKDTWSPSEFPVAYRWQGSSTGADSRGAPRGVPPTLDEAIHFGYSWPEPAPSDEEVRRTRPYQAGQPLAAATLDGVIHLAHPGVGNPLVLTETFSLAGILTPKYPVMDGPQDETCDGAGTLAQAGWSLQQSLNGTDHRASSGLVMARVGSQLALLSQPAEDGPLHLSLGEYC